MNLIRRIPYTTKLLDTEYVKDPEALCTAFTRYVLGTTSEAERLAATVIPGETLRTVVPVATIAVETSRS